MTRIPKGWRLEQQMRVGAMSTKPATGALFFEIPSFHPPSLNGSGGLMARHWSHRYRAANKAKVLVRAALGIPPYPRFEAPVRVRFWRIRRSGGPMDRDNAIASWKLLGDILQELGILANDSLIRDLQVNQSVSREKRTLVFVGPLATSERFCRSCWCTERDCRQCIARTGEACIWVDKDLCSACAQG